MKYSDSHKPLPGIYTITNKVNNKIYVGSATYSTKSRLTKHLSDLRKNKHPNNYLQKSFNKYKEENFLFEHLESHSSEYCLSMEQYWMNLLEATNREKGYNICPLAGNSFGYKHTTETKKILSIKGKGRTAWNKGKKDWLSKNEIINQSILKGKPTLQYNLNGELVAEWRSSRHAARTLGYCQAAINKCCKGKQSLHKNFIWKFKELENEKI